MQSFYPKAANVSPMNSGEDFPFFFGSILLLVLESVATEAMVAVMANVPPVAVACW